MKDNNLQAISICYKDLRKVFDQALKDENGKSR